MILAIVLRKVLLMVRFHFQSEITSTRGKAETFLFMAHITLPLIAKYLNCNGGYLKARHYLKHINYSVPVTSYILTEEY